jgi:hypothetical protein
MTNHERDVITFLISFGSDVGFTPEDPQATAADRERWLKRVADVRVGNRCACRTCPSIDLEDADGYVAISDDHRVILEAFYPGALLMLVIDDDRPSYLELAPIDEDIFDEFPSVAELSGYL